MRHCKGGLLAIMIYLGVSAPAAAQAYLATNRACPNENASLSVSFNGVDKDVSAAKSKLDAKIAEVKSLAGEEQFTKFDVQSYNYSINANYNGSYGGEMQFQYNGNATFAVLPADKAVEFMAVLAKKGYQTSVSVSSYNSGNCSPSSRK